MARKMDAAWTTYGSPDPENPEETILTCPECKDTFTSLNGFKGHMTNKHGGFSAGELIAATEASAEAGESDPNMPEVVKSEIAQAEVIHRTREPAEVQEPKRLTKRSRELNDKVNDVIQLLIKHMTKGLTPDELARIESARGELATAIVGVEFDFERKMLAITGNFWLIVLLIAMYTVPALPTAKELFVKAKAAADKQKEAKNADKAK